MGDRGHDGGQADGDPQLVVGERNPPPASADATGASGRTFTPRRLVGGLIACALLTVVHVWPIALSPGGQSFDYHDDALQITWTVTWIASQVTHRPLDLLNGNIFYPDERSLVSCEPLIVPGLMGVPVYAASADPVLTHNLVWLAGFVLSAFAMYCLVLYLGNDSIAALVAGSLFIFNSHIASRYAHLMAVHMEWLPLSLLALERYVDHRQLRQTAWLGLFVALAALSSGHLAVYTLVALGIVFMARGADWLTARPVSMIGGLALAALLASALAVPVLYPWLDGGLSRNVVGQGATLEAYLAGVSLLHRGWSGEYYVRGGGVGFFPGVGAIVMALYALLTLSSSTPRHARRIIAYCLLGIAGIALSLGAQTPVLGALQTILPPARAIRDASRLGYLFLTAVALLAGLGLATFRRRHRTRTWATGVAVALLVAVNVEAFVPPRTVPRAEISPIYDAVREHRGDTVLLELPYYRRPGTWQRNARYMFNSTAHWKPLVNGYGSYLPDWHKRFGHRLERFPEPSSVRMIRRLKVTHLMVNTTRYGTDALATVLQFLSANRRFTLVATDAQGRQLYRVADRAQRLPRRTGS